MTVPIGDPDAPGIREALVYLAGLGVPRRDVQHIVITGGYREPTTITVTLLVRDEPKPDHDYPDCPPSAEGCPWHEQPRETVRFEPGPELRPGSPDLQDAPTARLRRPTPIWLGLAGGDSAPNPTGGVS